MFREECEKLTN